LHAKAAGVGQNNEVNSQLTDIYLSHLNFVQIKWWADENVNYPECPSYDVDD